MDCNEATYRWQKRTKNDLRHNNKNNNGDRNVVVVVVVVVAGEEEEDGKEDDDDDSRFVDERTSFPRFVGNFL